ncbi:DUF222 domain-containing protein [Microbispora rosea]|uniref:DUF222 domain-containing protein n=1 Tax=Microbispora rosea TaxID=58117 RepID=UPI0013565D42|nr:DUF222 domain-containing protein [Microbispora rosea]
MGSLRESAQALALAPLPEDADVCLAEAEDLLFARDRITCALADRVGRVHRAGQAKQHGHASTRSWLRTAAGMSVGGAGRLLTLAVELARLPRVREKFATGQLAAGVVEAICAATANLSGEHAGVAEPILLELAGKAGAAEVAKAGRYLRAVLDPDGEDRDERAEFGRRFLRVRPGRGGGLEGEFSLPREAAARLRALLDAYAKPRAEGDDRPLSVRQADAFIALLEQKIATELLVLVNAESLPTDPAIDAAAGDTSDPEPADSDLAATAEGTNTSAPAAGDASGSAVVRPPPPTTPRTLTTSEALTAPARPTTSFLVQWATPVTRAAPTTRTTRTALTPPRPGLRQMPVPMEWRTPVRGAMPVPMEPRTPVPEAPTVLPSVPAMRSPASQGPTSAGRVIAEPLRVGPVGAPRAQHLPAQHPRAQRLRMQSGPILLPRTTPHMTPTPGIGLRGTAGMRRQRLRTTATCAVASIAMTGAATSRAAMSRAARSWAGLGRMRRTAKARAGAAARRGVRVRRRRREQRERRGRGRRGRGRERHRGRRPGRRRGGYAGRGRGHCSGRHRGRCWGRCRGCCWRPGRCCPSPACTAWPAPRLWCGW